MSDAETGKTFVIPFGQDPTGATNQRIQFDALGNIRTSSASSPTAPLTYSAPASASVGVASAQVLASNANRKYASFVNDSPNVIYLGIGAAAVVGSGIRLNADGGSFEILSGNLTTQVVNAIATVAASNLTVQEAV